MRPRRRGHLALLLLLLLLYDLLVHVRLLLLQQLLLHHLLVPARRRALLVRVAPLFFISTAQAHLRTHRALAVLALVVVLAVRDAGVHLHRAALQPHLVHLVFARVRLLLSSALDGCGMSTRSRDVRIAVQARIVLLLGILVFVLVDHFVDVFVCPSRPLKTRTFIFRCVDIFIELACVFLSEARQLAILHLTFQLVLTDFLVN